MKYKVIWVSVSLIVMLTISAGYHWYLSKNPHKVLVAIDSSFSMEAKASEVEEITQKMQSIRRYTRYSLITDKAIIHNWQPRIKPGTITFYGPRNLTGFYQGMKINIISEANRRILITNSPAGELNKFSNWQIYYLR